MPKFESLLEGSGLEARLQMNDEDFKLLRDFIRAESGIHFGESSKPILEKRMSRLVRARRIRSYRDYYYFLRYDKRKDEEMDSVIDAVTTNETYFFREERQLKAFKDEILPELHAEKLSRGDRTLRIWSAGCSSGEEPYTLAMLIMESKLFNDWRVEIFGSDINRRVLQIARKGSYGNSSFRVTEKGYIDRYFKEDGGRRQISEDVKKLVNFSYMNLVDRPKINLLRTMDVIYCRNVIIYFELSTKKALIESLGERLAPGGFLMLGHSESLINITSSYELRHLKNDLVYQKPRKRRIF
ncbi:MAG: protein-glutamate O-methyltransferase CheR [Deltaproteobacteria bacterium]|nr:protein-glutamate O-methyltransferase CheR [Deltaproteobacteria bacterium]